MMVNHPLVKALTIDRTLWLIWSEIGQCPDLLIIHISYRTTTKKH